MTVPEPMRPLVPPPVTDLNPIPDHHAPWTAPGCTFSSSYGGRCDSEDTVTLSHIGRRCAEHPPEFDPAVAVSLHVDGWTDTAAAYVRWSW